MPVTARLSKRFYDALGEDVANELVEWFNAVDATYKADLRELIEIQAQRFDARLEQRNAEMRTEMAALRAEVRGEIASLRTDMASLRADLLKWMFLFWIGTIGMVGTILGLIKS